MAILTQGANPASRAPSWGESLSPLAQAIGTRAGQHRQQQQNIAQGQILDSVLQEIASKGENVSATDIFQALSKGQQQGLSPQMVQQFQENFPKFQAENRKAGQVDPQTLAAMAEMRKAQGEEHKQAYEVNKPIIEPIQKMRPQTTNLSNSLQNSLKAVNSGNVGFLSKSHLAELSGWSSQLAPEGKLLKNAMKDYYGLVKQYFGGNPSNWESQQIEDLLAKVGSNEHANRVGIYSLMSKNEMDKLAIKTYDDIVRDNGGRIPFNLGEQMAERMGPEQQKISQDLGNKINHEMEAYNKKPTPKKKGAAKQKMEAQPVPVKSKDTLGRKQNSNDVLVRHRKEGGEPFRIPRSEYQPHPDLEEIEDTANQ